MRLGVDEAGVTELMGVTEHTRAMAATAAALLLESLDGTGTLIAPLEPAEAESPGRALLDEIATWAGAALGNPEVPVVWRILARTPYYLEATWRKEVALMGTAIFSRSSVWSITTPRSPRSRKACRSSRISAHRCDVADARAESRASA